jgi:hypothetical protein
LIGKKPAPKSIRFRAKAPPTLLAFSLAPIKATVRGLKKASMELRGRISRGFVVFIVL